jgi:hypothetical protein
MGEAACADEQKNFERAMKVTKLSFNRQDLVNRMSGIVRSNIERSATLIDSAHGSASHTKWT